MFYFPQSNFAFEERAGLNLKHDRPGLLGMGNSGKNSNTSQFYVTLGKTPQCDGKHVIFGEGKSRHSIYPFFGGCSE